LRFLGGNDAALASMAGKRSIDPRFKHPFFTNFMQKFIVLSVFIAFFFQISTAQQAWTSPQGKFYSQIGFTQLKYDGYAIAKQFDAEPLGREITNHSLQGYIQYGISNKLMATGILPFTIAKSTTVQTPQPVGLADGSLNALSNVQAALTFMKKTGSYCRAKPMRFYQRQKWMPPQACEVATMPWAFARVSWRDMVMPNTLRVQR
jgi:hypothetical protein